MMRWLCLFIVCCIPAVVSGDSDDSEDKCSCNYHNLVSCVLQDESTWNSCPENTQCSRNIVTHEGDEEHMHDKELECCFDVARVDDESIYYHALPEESNHFYTHFQFPMKSTLVFGIIGISITAYFIFPRRNNLDQKQKTK